MSETATFSQVAQDKYSNSTSTSNSNPKEFNNSTSNSTVLPKDVLKSIPDLINPDYTPWFAKQLRILGYTRFMELANKARAGSDTPKELFRWMLRNSEIVK